VERSGTPGFARYSWDGQNIHRKFDTGGNDDFYVYEPRKYGNLVAKGSPQRFYHYDDLGSTLMLTNSSATGTDIYSYTGWGEVTADSINTARNPFMFVGRMGYCHDPEFSHALGR
jgi:hypothetical protein